MVHRPDKDQPEEEPWADDPTMDVLDRNDSLNKRIEELVGRTEYQTFYAERTRKLSYGLTIGFMFLALMAGWNAVNTLRIRTNTVNVAHATDITEAISKALESTCNDLEKVKAGDLSLWTFALNAPPRQGQAPPDPATIAAFKKLLDQVFAAKSCRQSDIPASNTPNPDLSSPSQSLDHGGGTQRSSERLAATTYDSAPRTWRIVPRGTGPLTYEEEVT